MGKSVKVDKEAFERVIGKMIATPPATKAEILKPKKKLARVR
jgi:hypothetical protein